MAPNDVKTHVVPTTTERSDGKKFAVWSRPIEENESAVNSDPATKPTISNAISSIKMEDFSNVQNTPCARQGFLYGIGGGFGIGSIQYLVSGRFGKAANWAAGGFMLGSVISYEYCQYQRRAERTRMKRHVEVYQESQRERDRAEAAKREQKKQREEEAERQAAAKNKPWYKMW